MIDIYQSNLLIPLLFYWYKKIHKLDIIAYGCFFISTGGFMKRYKILLFLLLLLSQTSYSQSYKSFKYSRKQINYFAIEFIYKDNVINFIGHADSTDSQLRMKRDDLKINSNNIYFNDKVLFDDKKLILENINFPYDRITETRISESDSSLIIEFLTGESQSILDNFKRGNRIEYSENIIIDSGTFIRGCVISITGNIRINGEANKDVISLFGNIGILENGVVRGDIASLRGDAILDNQASVYGETYSYDNKGRRKHHKYLQVGKEFTSSENIAYNRIDGLKLAWEVKYNDINSFIPNITMEAGYALESKRFRFKLNLEQQLKYDPYILLGGTIYKQLESDDDLIMSDKENTAFALFFNEDYKDFYEAEGGNIYIKYKPNSILTLESGYDYFESKWLRAHLHLWSLFGGDKLFRQNFSSVEDEFRIPSIQELNATSIGTIYGKIDYSTEPSFSNPFDKSGWKLSGFIEWSNPDLSSDFDFRRYWVNVRRFHKLNNKSVLIVRCVFANSGGYLPMHKRYYLGGAGSLPGYDHKQFIGTRFWMANLEYRFIFYKDQISIAPSWNSAQIANDKSLNSDIEIKNSFGISLYIANQLKFEIAKRLDRSIDSKFKFYARFDQQF